MAEHYASGVWVRTRIGACVALCEDMHGADYDVAATVSAQRQAAK
ncbi:hypothetical protein [Arthrobacter sp. ISL-72]|nr:hypothetical protein [Arthrobacter sp. ISL-72]